MRLGGRRDEIWPTNEQSQSQDSSGTLEQRVATVIQAYDAQGNHRTGTEVDRASGGWLTEEVRRLASGRRTSPEVSDPDRPSARSGLAPVPQSVIW